MVLWDIDSSRNLGTVTVSGFCNALAISPDSQWLVMGGMEYGGGQPTGKIRLWRTSEIM